MVALALMFLASAEGIKLADNASVVLHPSPPPFAADHETSLDTALVYASIQHCFSARRIWTPLTKLRDSASLPPSAYMHSGTAVTYYGCRKLLNDIDLWIPLMGPVGSGPVHKKVPLAEAYSEKLWHRNAKWEKAYGMTDKGKAEFPEQVYCPQKMADPELSHKLEVDAFIGEGGPFDSRDFEGLATRAMQNGGHVLVRAHGTKARHSYHGITLKVIGRCELIELKYKLLTWRDKPKPTDVEDLTCLCGKFGRECGICPEALGFVESM